MSEKPIDPAVLQMVEEMGFCLERLGSGRMAGRIFGWMLVCEPAEQSADDLARALSASKGSISTATRYLLQHKAIERVARPGERRSYFRLAGQTALRALEHDMPVYRGLRDVFEKALALGPRGRPQRREIETYLRMFAFLERELPRLMEQFRRELGKGR